MLKRMLCLLAGHSPTSEVVAQRVEICLDDGSKKSAKKENAKKKGRPEPMDHCLLVHHCVVVRCRRCDFVYHVPEVSVTPSEYRVQATSIRLEAEETRHE